MDCIGMKGDKMFAEVIKDLFAKIPIAHQKKLFYLKKSISPLQ